MRGTSFRREIRGLQSISLCTMRGEAKYDVYRETWGLCGRRLKSAIRRAEPSSLQRLNRTERSSQAGGNGWRRQRTTASVIRSVAVSFRRRQRRARRDSVSVHPAIHIRTLVTGPSWTSPRELVPAEVFLLRYVSFQTAWRVRGARKFVLSFPLASTGKSHPPQLLHNGARFLCCGARRSG